MIIVMYSHNYCIVARPNSDAIILIHPVQSFTTLVVLYSI